MRAAAAVIATTAATACNAAIAERKPATPLPVAKTTAKSCATNSGVDADRFKSALFSSNFDV